MFPVFRSLPFVMADDSDPVRIPITGELDLHAFRPAEAASVVEEYLAACRERGLASAGKALKSTTGTTTAVINRNSRSQQITILYPIAILMAN